MHIYFAIVAAGITLWMLFGLRLRWVEWRINRAVLRLLEPPQPSLPRQPVPAYGLALIAVTILFGAIFILTL